MIKEAYVNKAFQGKAVQLKKIMKEATADFEKEFITNNLLLNDWNVAQTAAKIGIDRSNLHKKIKQYKVKIRKD